MDSIYAWILTCLRPVMHSPAAPTADSPVPAPSLTLSLAGERERGEPGRAWVAGAPPGAGAGAAAPGLRGTAGGGAAFAGRLAVRPAAAPQAQHHHPLGRRRRARGESRRTGAAYQTKGSHIQPCDTTLPLG